MLVTLRNLAPPPAVRAIEDWAFYGCSQLVTAILNNGLEVIGKGAFEECRSLCKNLFPPSVRTIENHALYCCSGLTTVILNDGLEVIGEQVFQG